MKIIKKAFCLAFVVTFANCAHGAQNKPLDKEVSHRIKSFLFPLPQECIFGKQLFSFPAKTCEFKIEFTPSVIEKQFILNFKKRWGKKFNVSLNTPLANKNSQLKIIIRRNSSNQVLDKAATDKLLLNKLPNSDQAYAITCTKTKSGANIYLDTISSSGLYYALYTLEQLASGVRVPGTITIPAVKITDWPDIQFRGIWGCVRSNKGDAMSEELACFSAAKLNIWERPSMSVRINKQEEFNYTSITDLQQEARRHNIRIIPYLSHLSNQFKSSWHSDLYKLKDKITAPKGIKSHGQVWCWNKPESQKVLYKMIMKIAGTAGINDLSIWLSEWNKTACGCSQCKGDVHANYINEIKNILEAYQKVKLKYPNFNISILTTQGSYSTNDEIFKLIPEDVDIDFYGGSGKGNTYHTENRPILNGYPVKALLAKGHSLGVFPLFAPSHSPALGVFPFNTPSLVKLRMQEVHVNNMSRVYAYFPYVIFHHDINVQAEAEYAWNSSGRSLEEFAFSWAVRNGYANPQAIGKIINLLDEPSRMLSIGINANTFDKGLQRMVDQLLNIKPKYFDHFNLLKGLNVDNTEKHAKALVDKCNQALKIARQCKNKEFIANAELLKQWMLIVHEYSIFLDSSKSAQESQKAKHKIAQLAFALPQLWTNWIAFQKIPQRRKKTITTHMDNVMKGFKRL